MFKETNSTPKLYSTLTCLHPTGQTGFHCLIHTTGQTGHTDRSDRSSQNRGVAHTALKGAIRQLPSLGVSLHHFPPLCISADELDTTGAEVNIRMA